jgi:hypothetical protein
VTIPIEVKLDFMVAFVIDMFYSSQQKNRLIYSKAIPQNYMSVFK